MGKVLGNYHQKAIDNNWGDDGEAFGELIDRIQSSEWKIVRITKKVTRFNFLICKKEPSGGLVFSRVHIDLPNLKNRDSWVLIGGKGIVKLVDT